MGLNIRDEIRIKNSYEEERSSFIKEKILTPSTSISTEFLFCSVKNEL